MAFHNGLSCASALTYILNIEWGSKAWEDVQRGTGLTTANTRKTDYEDNCKEAEYVVVERLMVNYECQHAQVEMKGNVDSALGEETA